MQQQLVTDMSVADVCNSLSILAMECPKYNFLSRMKALLTLHNHWKAGHEVKVICVSCEPDFTDAISVEARGDLQAAKNLDFERGSSGCGQAEICFLESENMCIKSESDENEIGGIESHTISSPARSEVPELTVGNNRETTLSRDCRANYKRIVRDATFYPLKTLKSHLRLYKRGPYVCCHCRKGFQSASQLKLHCLRHENEKPFTCIVCDAAFTRYALLKVHTSDHTTKTSVQGDQRLAFFVPGCDPHPRAHFRSDTNFQCSWCAKTFTNQTSLKRHVTSSHRFIGPLSCGWCEKTFTVKSRLKEHEKLHVGSNSKPAPDMNRLSESRLTEVASIPPAVVSEHQPIVETRVTNNSTSSSSSHAETNAYSCTICDSSFRRPESLKLHIRFHKKRPYVCCFCHRYCQRPLQLKLHILMHENQRPFTCVVCDLTFSSSALLKLHTLVHLSDKPFQCDRCPARFKLSSHLRQHAVVHSADRPYRCQWCSKSFKLSVTLRSHVANLHSDVRPFACGVCDKRFADRSRLTQHEKLHSGVNSKRRHRCEVCGKLFISPSAVKMHMQLHTGEKYFKCDVCGESFTTPSSFNKHRRLLGHHSNSDVPRVFICNFCGKSFDLRRSLEYHTFVHTGEKPFLCQLCGQSFRRPNILRVHMLSHSDERRNRCPMCSKSYKSQPSLKKHIDRRHAIKAHSGS